jgi:anti-sigma regulatory factor (Ser/Thr protein kinase)
MITDPDHGAVMHAMVSAEGRLVAADPPLLAMQKEAGGDLGDPLVIPALTHLARVAWRTGATIARPVTVGGSAQDIALWVRLKPSPDGIEIWAIYQDIQPAPKPDTQDRAAADAHGEMMRLGWTWQVDRSLRFTLADSGEDTPLHVLPIPGEKLSGYFRLIENADSEDGALPLLDAVAAGRPFAGQNAVVRREPDWCYMLSAVPMVDGRGRMTGYRGKARLLTADDRAPLERKPFERVQPEAAISEPVEFERQTRPEHQAPDASPELDTETDSWSPVFSRRLDNALRQPLGRIVANANTISGQLEGPLRTDYASYAADIAAAGRHLLELVDDLADLQAIERPNFTAAREQVELADLSRRAAGLLRMRAAERSIIIQAPKDDESVSAMAEYRRVLQILVNLIGNAVRYSPDQSHVWIRVDEDPAAGTVSVIVADQGRGIDPADHERIFDRFVRLTPEDNNGSGLGLYISRRLARAMGGDITVESALGRGARFKLTLRAWH